MTTVTIQLLPESAEKLRQKASLFGKTLEGYLQELLQQEALAANDPALAATAPPSSVEELDRCLDELSADLPALPRLPADLSRGDLYGEHD
jgi:hypothetical protein